MSGNGGSSARGWAVAVMLAVFMVINFMDKAVLGIVARPVMAELQLTPAAFGLIASSFFLLFSVSAIGVGLVADRFSSKAMLMVLAAVWGLSQLPLAFAASVPWLLFSRILLGAGEGPAYPLALHACYRWFPDDRRNLPTAVVYQGVTLGLLISGPVLTFITVRHGWQATFLALSVASLVWMLLWGVVGRDGPLGDGMPGHRADETAQKPAGPPGTWTAWLTDRTFLGNLALYWTAYWLFAVLFTWIPSYLESALGYTPAQAGWLFMLFTGINIPIVLAGSWWSQRLLKRGVPSARARGWLCCGFVLLGGLLIGMAFLAAGERTLHLILLALGFNLPQLTFVLSGTIVAEIAPGARRSGLLSINSALATTGGLLAPVTVGWLIGSAATPAAGYATGFLWAATLAVVAGGVGLATIDPAATRRRLSRYAGPRD